MAEATETTETQAPETTEPIAPEPTTPPEEGQEPQAPDVGEALQQMGERLQSFESRLPEAEQEQDLYAALTGFEQPDGEEGADDRSIRPAGRAAPRTRPRSSNRCSAKPCRSRSSRTSCSKNRKSARADSLTGRSSIPDSRMRM
jgi:hypothetical protein